MRLILSFAVVFLICGRAGAANNPLLQTHDALFAAMLPINSQQVQRDEATRRMFAAARSQMWTSAAELPAFQHLLAPFADLRSFGAVCGIGGYLRKTGQTAFKDLTPPQQQHILYLMQTCSDNAIRQFAANARSYYVTRVYGMLQEKLANITLQLFAPPQYIAEHRPRLPPTRLRFDPKRNEVSLEGGPIDYLIVGSGPAGSVLAHELRRGGKRVLLVERGSLVVPGSMETRSISDLVDTRTSSDGSVLIHNGNAVGGGSLVNVDLCFAPTLPSVQAMISTWRREGRIGSADFTSAEIAAAYHWVKSALGTRAVSESEINANNRVLWNGAIRAGLHPKLYELNTYRPGTSPYPISDKRSAETQLILPALEDRVNPLSLLPDAEVQRVLFEQHGSAREAIGVQIRMRSTIRDRGAVADPNKLRIPPGSIITIRAKTVILSAGALGSPAILLRSGLKNDWIGRGVILHPSIPILGRFDHVIDALKGTQASVFVDDALMTEGYALEAMSAEPVYVALMSPGPAIHTLDLVKAFRYLAGFGVMLIDTPSPRNRIWIDADGKIQIDYTLSQADKQRLRRGLQKAIEVMFLAGAKEVYVPTTEDAPQPLGSEGGELRPAVLHNRHEARTLCERIQFIPNRTILTSAHMQATDKMGSSPSNSVVSRNFQVWGVNDLYVVDGSIFPTSIGANPMQSIYTFAKIFADRMQRRR